MAFQFCTGCLRRVDTEDIYGKALTIGMPGGDYEDGSTCKVYEYCLKDRPIVDIDYVADLIGRITNESYFIYKSKYIRAEFYFTTNRDYFMSLYDDKENPVESDIELKKTY